MDKRMSALEFALENELKERDFYLSNARRTKNLAGKNMFKQIADEEKEHYEMLKKLHDKWEKQKKWPATVPLKVKKSLTKNILRALSGKRAARIEGNDDDLKAIRTAIDFEARGVALYTKLEKQSTEPKEKAFFNLLASVEREHLLSLRDTEQFLTDPASWYQNTEKTLLDGA
ncbi:MAG TPA: ferritin family protein [Smithellaceae bacterium]|jgi:rubrerythrin|nr:MAG: putative trifunctional 2-polyprenylphenol hydroxylase/glutamate synthase subunit beta/ferritin domain-containing protein [Deltaproteobacteria bacterium ADurb.BinA014]HNQ17951.1 ferritin family protein [Smithellaceae bacterium]HNT90614.1 ferritin family protein [Smithellaceae bacterium]HNV64129.1 ferritin family protein [Smithellaceae bacterium]HNZ30506.1 ferritin family protein [Smithellaceae bacterium]